MVNINKNQLTTKEKNRNKFAYFCAVLHNYKYRFFLWNGLSTVCLQERQQYNPHPEKPRNARGKAKKNRKTAMDLQLLSFLCSLFYPSRV